jgi:hypothetical protein
MSERTPEPKVKSVDADDDCLCIELFNGLRLTGPLRTRPVYRDQVVPPTSEAVSHAELAAAT